jgi:hypothetical protein
MTRPARADRGAAGTPGAARRPGRVPRVAQARRDVLLHTGCA